MTPWYAEPLNLRNQQPENRCLTGRAKRAGITQTTEGNNRMVLADQNWIRTAAKRSHEMPQFGVQCGFDKSESW